MKTNFDYLTKEHKFHTFADVAVSAEKIINIDPQASILNARRAMEFALKWMYSVDDKLEMPYQDNLQTLMNSEDYRQIIGNDLWKRMNYIRMCGNMVAHSRKKIGKDEAMLCLENLFIYLDYIAYCYSDSYEKKLNVCAEFGVKIRFGLEEVKELEKKDSLISTIESKIKEVYQCFNIPVTHNSVL